MSDPPEIALSIAFGRVIRRRRRALDMSQQSLAARASLSFRHIGEIERGNGDPRLSTVSKLLSALEVPRKDWATFWDEVHDHGGQSR